MQAPRIGDESALHNLYRRFGQLTAEGSAGALARLLLTHPASLVRLRLACEHVLRESREERYLRDDLFQQAALLVLKRISRGSRLPYQDRGADRFGGWLWSVWYRASLSAWRNVRRIPLGHEPLSEEHLAVAALADNQPTRVRCEQLLETIGRIGDRELRQVAADWISGLSGAQSARERGISRASVCRRRGRVTELLRELLAIELLPAYER